MTSQQLIQARAALWHQNAEPILTLEDATAWVETQGFLLFLPRKQQLPAPAPSFVEACLGTLEHTPARAAIEDALELAKRLFASGEAIPLNLFGTLSEEPDFLISREQLPWLLSLRADRSWKTAPGGRTSPLHVNIWKLLDEQDALSVEEIRSGVGREVTEAAVRRALIDLWGTLRVVPSYQVDGTEWALVKAAYPRESAKGTTTAQGTALSLFLAGYLRSAIAANEDEITAFLSPLASRSKVREVLHALLTTRQLDTVTLGPNTLYHVADELPEFPEIAPAEEAEDAIIGEDGAHEAGEPLGQETAPAGGERIRKYTPRGERPAREGGYQREDRRPREYGNRPGGFSRPDRSSSREDRPAARGYGRPGGPRSSEGEYRGRQDQPENRQSDRPRWNDRNDRSNRQDRPGQNDRPRFSDRREGSFDRPPRREGGFKPRGDGGFKPRGEGGFKPRGEGGFKPRGEGGFKPRGRDDRFSGGFRPPFRKQQDEGGAFADNRRFRGEGEQSRPNFRDREAGDRRSFGKKPFGRSSSGEGFQKRKPFGESREDSRPNNFSGDRPARKSFGGPRREGGSFDRPRRDNRPDGRQGDRKFDRRPSSRREGSEGAGERPRRSFEGNSERPARKSFGKPGGFSKSGNSRPAGKSFGKKPGSGFGGAKKSFGKGGSGKPFGKGPGKGFGKGPGKGFGKPKRRPEE